jgi:heme/copper-type cytochrome/quinol oxidase subunit 2
MMIDLITTFSIVRNPMTGDACPLPNPHFFFLPPWWEYLSGKIDGIGQCSPTLYNTAGNVQIGDIWLVGLAVLDMLLRIAGFVAVVSIIIAGFQYQFTSGNPEKAAAARKRISNSIIGLVIALVATAGVTFIGNQLAK